MSEKENKDTELESNEDRPATKASESEWAVAFDGPAVAVTRSFYTAAPGGIRLAFVEQIGDIKQFRAAVFLNFDDAIALKNLLVRNLTDIEVELTKIKEEQESSGSD